MAIKTRLWGCVWGASRATRAKNEKKLKEADDLSKEHKISLGDAVHGILARDNNAIMITRDRHFRKLKDKITIKKPEDLI